MAWHSIWPEVTQKGFKQCCASKVVDVTSDMLWNVSDKDGHVSVDCEEDEGTNREDQDRIWHSLSIKCSKLMRTFYFLGWLRFA
jgi:hypothetical protein